MWVHFCFFRFCWRSSSDKHLLRLFAPGRRPIRQSCCRCNGRRHRRWPVYVKHSGSWAHGPQLWQSDPCGDGCPWWQAHHPVSRLCWGVGCLWRDTPGRLAHWGSPPFHWRPTGSLECHLKRKYKGKSRSQQKILQLHAVWCMQIADICFFIELIMSSICIIYTHSQCTRSIKTKECYRIITTIVTTINIMLYHFW